MPNNVKPSNPDSPYMGDKAVILEVFLSLNNQNIQTYVISIYVCMCIYTQIYVCIRDTQVKL